MGWLGDLLGLGVNLWQKNDERAWNEQQAQINRDFQSNEAALNREFQSSEAALQRIWSAAEAERARDWNEEMYEKYNSLSGKIAQAEQAGVNPMLAITGNAVSPMQTGAAAPTGASAGSVGTPSGSSASSQFVDLVATYMGLKKLRAESELMESQAQNLDAQTEKTATETGWIDKLSTAQLENLLMSTSEIESKIHVNDATASKLSAESQKLQKEGIRISRITDSEVRRSEAQALLSEYQASVINILNDFEGANTEDYLLAGAKLLSDIIGIGMTLSPKGIVHMN